MLVQVNHFRLLLKFNRTHVDAHHNLQNLVAMSQVNNGGKLKLLFISSVITLFLKGLLPTANSSAAASGKFCIYLKENISYYFLGSFPVFPSASYLTTQVAGKHTEGLFNLFFLIVN